MRIASSSHGLTFSLTWMPQSEVRLVPTVGRATAENMNSLTAMGARRSLSSARASLRRQPNTCRLSSRGWSAKARYDTGRIL